MDDLHREVEQKLSSLLGGRLLDAVANTGAAGLCWDVSKELVERLGRGRLLYLDFPTRTARLADLISGYRRLDEYAPWPAWAEDYISNDMHDLGHCVAVVDGYVVDLTAKQFGGHLPFPMVVSL